MVLPLTCLYNYIHFSNCYLITIPSIFSLELDTPTITANPKPTSKESPDNQNTFVDNQVQSEEWRPNVCDSNCHVPEVLEGSPQETAAENIECVDLNKGNGDLSFSENRVAISEEGSPQKVVHLGHSTTDKLNNSSDASQLVGKILNEQNGMKSGPCGLEDTENHSVGGNSGSLKRSNGFTSTESVIISGNGLGSSSELGSVKLSGSREVCNQVNSLSTKTGVTSNVGKPDADDHTVHNNFSSSNTSISTESAVCFYQCCPECLDNLHSLTQKILIHEWGLNRSHWTVEDVHDIVASLSVDLLSLVKKNYFTEDFSNSFDGKLKDRKCIECPEMINCHCKSSGDGVLVPVECSCHSRSQSVTAKANTSPNNELGLDSKFLFRDGVLVNVDPDKDVSFHCKFEALCLCSLIELMVMTKQPFD